MKLKPAHIYFLLVASVAVIAGSSFGIAESDQNKDNSKKTSAIIFLVLALMLFSYLIIVEVQV
jgi:hypothetical protein